jgi:CheY-like chemotaxis protein
MKILIAEDERDILTQYRLALEGRDNQVVTTADGEECLNTYMAASQKQAKPFDSVELDHRMLKMDWTEVAKHILAPNPHERIIFASAYVN